MDNNTHKTSILTERLDFFTELVKEYLPLWTVGVNKRLKYTLARTWHFRDYIEISYELITEGSFDIIWQVMMHEIAHGLCGGEHGHSSQIYRQCCKELGTVSSSHIDCGLEQLSKYVFECIRCGQLYHRDRLKVIWKSGRARCGKCKGKLKQIK